MKTLYNAALFPVRAASVVFRVWPRKSPEAALERDQRLARRLPTVRPGAVWVHGASVGEARIVESLAAEIRRRRPEIALMASAMTRTGRERLPAPPAVDASFFLPLDFAATQRRAFDTLAPSMLVLVETELWPNLLGEAAERDVPVVVVNGRLAPERLSRYRFFSGLYRPLLAHLAAVGVAAREEAARFAALGVPAEALYVIGNLKFDLPPPQEPAAAIRARLGLPESRPVVVAGSTGSGEDALVLDAFTRARRAIPRLFLILAPRHPSRFDSACEEASRRGFRVARLSAGGVDEDADVLVVDGLGQLAALYAVAEAAFVGGSLVGVGGHNLLEPLVAGAPVLFGPHTHHVAEIASALTRYGAGVRVPDVDALGREWVKLASRPHERARLIEAGRTFIAMHRGAVGRAVDLILGVLDRPPHRPAS